MMIQITPQMRILVAIEPVDFRCGIDGLAQLCKQRLQDDPFSGCVFVFRNWHPEGRRSRPWSTTDSWIGCVI